MVTKLSAINGGVSTAYATATDQLVGVRSGTTDLLFTVGTLATLNAAPAGTLTGTNLASNVVTSSLTSLGTLTALAIAGIETITATDANALTVGQNGATNPALQVDTSTASSVTGVAIKSAASGGVATITALGSAADVGLTITSKGAGALTFNSLNFGNLIFQTGGNTRMSFLNGGSTLTVQVGTSAGISTTKCLFTGTADGTIPASTEAFGVYFNWGQTRTWATGSLALQRDFRITGSTKAFAGASTITDNATFGVDGPGSAGTNATITNSHGVYVPTIAVTGTVTNAYAASFFAPTGGATRNMALNLNGTMFVDGSNNITGAGTIASGSHTITGVEAITATNANAFAVGQAGTTNPMLQIDSSTASAVTGFAIIGAAAASGSLLQVISSGTNEDGQFYSKGTGALDFRSGGSASKRITINNGNIVFNHTQSSFTAVAGSTASTVRFSVVNALDTALTASTEAPFSYFNMANQIRTHSTGALTLQRDFRVTGTTHAFVGASTITDAAAFSVDGPPSAGTNATITNAHGIYIPVTAITGTVTNAFGLTVNASTGATKNWGVWFRGQLLFASATPGIAAGAGAGGSPTIAIAGTNEGGIITLTTGTLPTTSAVIATITPTNAFPTNCSIVLTPANANTSTLSGASMVFVTEGTTSWTMTSGTVNLVAATAYKWHYQVIGY